MKVTKCWGFREDEQPPYPTIEITLSSADRSATITPKVDTGFNGSLAVDKEATKKLRVTPKGTTLIRTATGYSETSIYAINIRQSELGIDQTILAIGAQRSLVGRILLNGRKWLLDCKEQKLCLMTDSSA